MSTFPGTPTLLIGGLVLVEPERAMVLLIIAPHYNLDSLSRSFQIKGMEAEAVRSRVELHEL